MPPAKSKKNNKKQLLSLLIKLIVTSAAISYVYYEIQSEYSASEHGAFFGKPLIIKCNDPLAWTVVILMFINWGIETLKWQFLASQIEKITFPNALRAVLSGITVSVFTPKRVGEFAGRILYLSNDKRGEGAVAAIIGSISQLLITTISGMISFTAYYLFYIGNAGSGWMSSLIAVCSGTGIILLLILYFNTWIISGMLRKIKWIKKYRKYTEVFASYSSRQLMIVLLLSATRYITFTVQFYLLLIIFGVHISPGTALMLIALIFFTLAAIPTTVLSEAGIRESISLQVLGMVTAVKMPVVAASFGLWLLNIALPAVVGSVFILSARMFGNKAK